MLKKPTKETFDALLTVEGMGETVSLNLTYRNMPHDAFVKLIDEIQAEGSTRDMTHVICDIVTAWESEYELTPAGVREMENDRKGMIFAITQAYHDAREYAKVKN